MRNLNNWVKTSLINTAADAVAAPSNGRSSRGLAVLDLCCGMGGDILKWAKVKPGISKIVGVDIAINSLKHFASDRLKSLHPDVRKKVTHLICADMGVESLTSTSLPTHTWDASTGESKWSTSIPLSENDKFDIASCQFAIHYMFQTPTRANHFFAEVSRYLRPSGLFIATTIDCRVIADFAATEMCGEVENRSDDADNWRTAKRARCEASINDVHDKRQLTVKNDLGNDVLRVSFTSENWSRLLQSPLAMALAADDLGSAERSSFGVQYDFALQDDVSAAAVNAPEWLVPQGQLLESLAHRHGMRLLKSQNFGDYICEFMEGKSEV
jgi:ubiquinone/menaquinone biosynthesis C-methylase UbiE